MTGPADQNDPPQSEPTTELPVQPPEPAADAELRVDDGQATPDAGSTTPPEQPDFTAPVADQSPTFGAPAPAPSGTGTVDAAGQDAYAATKIRWINPRRRAATWLIAAAAAVVLAGAGFGAGWAVGHHGGRHIELSWDATAGSPLRSGAFPQRGGQQDTERPQLAPRHSDPQGSGPWNRQRGNQQGTQRDTQKQGTQQQGTQQQGDGQQRTPQQRSAPERPGQRPPQQGSNGTSGGSSGNGSGSSDGSGDGGSTQPAPTGSTPPANS